MSVCKSIILPHVTRYTQKLIYYESKRDKWFSNSSNGSCYPAAQVAASYLELWKS